MFRAKWSLQNKIHPTYSDRSVVLLTTHNTCIPRILRIYVQQNTARVLPFCSRPALPDPRLARRNPRLTTTGKLSPPSTRNQFGANFLMFFLPPAPRYCLLRHVSGKLEYRMGRWQARTLTNATPPICNIHQFSTITLTFEPIIQFWWLSPPLPPHRFTVPPSPST